MPVDDTARQSLPSDPLSAGRVPETPVFQLEPLDDLGLSIDMLDVDRLREWARLLLAAPCTSSPLGRAVHVAGQMQILATNLERAIRDIGALRSRVGAARQEPPATQQERSDAESMIENIEKCYSLKDTGALCGGCKDHLRYLHESFVRAIDDRDAERQRAEAREAEIAAIRADQLRSTELSVKRIAEEQRRAEHAEARFVTLVEGLKQLRACMVEFATTRPSPQQTRAKSAREMVELFAAELAALLAALPPAKDGQA